MGNYFTEMCSDSEAGSFSRRIDFVYHSTPGLRVMEKKKKKTIFMSTCCVNGTNASTVPYRGTPCMRNSPPPWGRHRALSIFLLYGPRRGGLSYDQRNPEGSRSFLAEVNIKLQKKLE